MNHQLREEPDESPLERLLRRSAGDPAYRAELLQALLGAQVLVLGDAPGDAAGGTGNDAGLALQIRHWRGDNGASAIPFFTSLGVLRDSIEHDENYLQLAARDLFEATRGTLLMLNPCSEYGMELTPAEVDDLLAPEATQVRRIAPGTRVVIGQPDEYPAALVDALTRLFAGHGNVRRAFLAQLHEPASGEPPHLVVGLDACGALETLLAAATTVVADAAPEAGFVAFMPLVPADSKGISGYFLGCQPFYERRWGRRLRTLLGSGNA